MKLRVKELDEEFNRYKGDLYWKQNLDRVIIVQRYIKRKIMLKKFSNVSVVNTPKVVMKRLQVIEEIIETERSYVNKLTLLVTVRKRIIYVDVLVPSWQLKQCNKDIKINDPRDLLLLGLSYSISIGCERADHSRRCV